MNISMQDRAVLAGLDFRLPCQTSGPEHAADVATVCRGCGDITYLCLSHHWDVILYVRRMLNAIPGASISCTACEHTETTHSATFRVVGII